ncbi:MAG TPA: UvrD-helicase domain-containing protein [Terriglobia bacterium]|nr:UvrD-helicase domain-containing protein [Terriglobia bacterium]
MSQMPAVDNRHFDDEAARHRIRTSLDESLLVEAAAGTGKTTELIGRIVALLRTGRARVEKLVAVTFTNKAAGELKLRLRQELDDALVDARQNLGKVGHDEYEHLEQAIAHLEEARIGTIHSFCADLLRERPVEAGIDPAYEELTEPEQRRLFRRAFRGWLEAKLGRSSPVLQRVLVRNTGRYRSPSDELYDAAWNFLEHRDFDCPWERRPFPREEKIDGLLERVVKLGALSRRCKDQQDALYVSLMGVRELAETLRRADDEGRGRDYDRLEGLLVHLQEGCRQNLKKGRSKDFAPGVLRKDVVQQREDLLVDLAAFVRDSGADLAALLQSEMRDLVAIYNERKRASGKLDFVDLLLMTRDLVKTNGEVRRYLQSKFTHILVDEFQDTDPLQAEILLLLAASDPDETDWLEVNPIPGKLFLVGDPKQSIYRFRRADVVLYQELRDRLKARGVGLVHLTHSFRAPKPLQDTINLAFAPEMKEDRESGQPGYVPLEAGCNPMPGQPYLVALPVPNPYSEYGNQRKDMIDASLPEAVAAFANWLIQESGWKVRDVEHSGELVPIKPRHIAVLFRRFSSWGEDVTLKYREALEVREVPYVVAGATAVHVREEMSTLRAALAAIEWPDDELSVFATLKGLLFAVPDSALLRYRELAGSLHPFRKRPESLESDLTPVSEALEVIATLSRQRNRRPIVETIEELLETTRAYAALALGRGGPQALASVYHLCDEARNFEASGGISFRAFVEELETQAERDERSESLVLEESSEGVRLITVHKAKGLEFPVVILADLTAKLSREAGRYTDGIRGLCAQRLAGCEPWDLLDHRFEETVRDEAEGVRVAYVAATRARDLLVVTALGQKPRDNSWLRPLHGAIYPDPAHRRQSTPALNCPTFGDATALAGYTDDRLMEELIKPGLHRLPDSGLEVVWWDPGVLALEVEKRYGLRQENLLGPPTSPESVRLYRAWKTAHSNVIADGVNPEFEVVAATEATPMLRGLQASIELESVQKLAGRPQGRRFGTLIHTALRDVPLAGTKKEVYQLARLHGRLLGAPGSEVEAAAQVVMATLEHPLLQRARSAATCHREFPLAMKMDSGRLVEGVLDLAFMEDGAWIVVDFKSDADLPARRRRYELQLGWYVYALSSITKVAARGVLLAL